MNYQDLRDNILRIKPKYNIKFKPLMERISVKGDSTGEGDFSTFGAFYQTFMYAYFIGLRLGEKVPLTRDEEKTEFAPISNWKPTPIRDFILITLLNRSEHFDNYSWDWLSLENGSEEHVGNFVTMLIREMEAYANRGLIYLQDKWDNEKILFASPFVFVDILQDLPYNNKQSLDIDSIPASDNI
jgi:hypothetical protein